MHEIKPGVDVQPFEQRAARSGIHDIPAHVRNHRGLKSNDRPRPVPAAWRLHTEFDPASKQNLHTDTDPQHRAAGGHPLGDDSLSADLAQARHARRESTDARHHQSVSGHCGVGIGGYFDLGAYSLQRTLGRPQVS
ncbi:Uncharacterised protein [Mycobacterium tuberculosis]|nr:Uncharacterised protein [Mycobacterium tuberculosis]